METGVSPPPPPPGAAHKDAWQKQGPVVNKGELFRKISFYSHNSSKPIASAAKWHGQLLGFTVSLDSERESVISHGGGARRLLRVENEL